MLAHRVRAWLSTAPLPRLRRILIALYLLVCAGDAGGKALATTPGFNHMIAVYVHGDSASHDVATALTPSGNFEIFRLSSRNLVAGQNLYAHYPEEILDRFKYSPTFALLFSPLTILPWPIALFLWSMLNAMVLFVAVGRVLPARPALLAQALLLLEVLRSMQNAQSNALVAGLIILAYSALEKNQSWRAATAVALGAAVKIFPIAALTFAIPRRMALRTGMWAVSIGTAFMLLPLFVTSPPTLLGQYRSWYAVATVDAAQRSVAGGQILLSLMELLHHWVAGDWPNWPIQVLATLVLLAPLVGRRERWSDARFRLLYLCSLLHYVVLFNHQTERPTMIIAFAGSTIWFVTESSTRWRTALYAMAWLAIPAASTLIPGAWLRTPTTFLYRMMLPTLAIWIAVQWEMMRGRVVSDRAGQ